MKHVKNFNEAIGFKIKNDNRDEPSGERSRLGFHSDRSEITDRLYRVIDKLQALAERGVGGEKDTAIRKLGEISKKYGINAKSKSPNSGKLGFRFSWEDEEFIKDIEKETMLIENDNWDNEWTTSEEEKQKILKTLSTIDDLIDTQTQRLESLKDHKKGLVQQLFPVKGKNVPKLRFPEFKDDEDWKWKIRKDKKNWES